MRGKQYMELHPYKYPSLNAVSFYKLLDSESYITDNIKY